MKIRLITGAIGVALCVSTLPAEARRPAPEADHSGAYGGGARMLDLDHHQFWSSRQASRGADSDDHDTRPETTPRRHPHARAARPSPRAASRNPRCPLAKPAIAKPAAVAARAVTSVARQTAGGGGARGCLSGSARALLERIEGQFGAVQIVSTCRPGAVIAGTGQTSRHASGHAIDFNAVGRKGEVVRWLIANHKSGGVMTYAGMSHVHVDIGYRFVVAQRRRPATLEVSYRASCPVSIYPRAQGRVEAWIPATRAGMTGDHGTATSHSPRAR